MKSNLTDHAIAIPVKKKPIVGPTLSSERSSEKA